MPVGEVLPAVGDDVPGDAVLGRERARAWTESGKKSYNGNGGIQGIDGNEEMLENGGNRNT